MTNPNVSIDIFDRFHWIDHLWLIMIKWKCRLNISNYFIQLIFYLRISTKWKYLFMNLIVMCRCSFTQWINFQIFLWHSKRKTSINHSVVLWKIWRYSSYCLILVRPLMNKINATICYVSTQIEIDVLQLHYLFFNLFNHLSVVFITRSDYRVTFTTNENKFYSLIFLLSLLISIKLH